VQIQAETSTDGVEFMDPAQDALIVVLKSIRDQADSVLKKIEQPAEQRSLSWKCAACGHTKHFTRPALSEVAAPCPKCGGETFHSV
jgi:rubrerythrin